MTKQKIVKMNDIDVKSVDGVTIGSLEPLSTSLIKDTDLFAVETDLSTNSISVSQVKEVVSNELLSYTNNSLGSIIFHPAPAGYQNIPSETNGFGDAILVADGRLLDKNDYLDLWNFIKTRKDKNIFGFNGENIESFKVDELTNKITLPNLLSGKVVYMGNYGVQGAIFPQHNMSTSSNIQPTTQPHSHSFTSMQIQQGSGGIDGVAYRFIYPKSYTDESNVTINPFGVSVSNISGLPSGVSVGNDYKIAGIKMIPCIVCKPTYQINGGGSGSGGGVATQDLDMNLFRILNVGVPVNDSDAVRLVDLKLDNSKILYKKNNTGGYDSLQASMDTLWSVVDNSVSRMIGLMDSSYITTSITDPQNIITLSFLQNYNSINGFVKADRSVNLVGDGLINSKQPASMSDLKADNIIYSNVVADTKDSKALVTMKTKIDDMDSIINNQATLMSVLQDKLNSYDTKYRSFTSKRVKSGLNININSNANNLTNLTQYFIASQNPTITSFGSSISGLPLGAINLIEVGSGANQGFKFPLINGIINCNLTFTIRVTGAISGNAGTPRELIVYLRRVSDNSLVANGGIIKVNDNNFNSRSVIVPSFLQGVNDAFYTGGFYLNILNNSGGTLTLSNIEMLIQAN